MTQTPETPGRSAFRSGIPVVTVNMGEYRLGEAGAQLCSVLGSCIGLVVFDPGKGRAGFAHVMLPESRGDRETPGKYADTAVEELAAALQRGGCLRGHLRAKIAGGARMFGDAMSVSLIDVGQRNIRAVKLGLQTAGIPLVAERTGGLKGRKVFFYPSDGAYLVSSFGAGEEII